jgi:CRP-like cAMP-binding protein
MRQSTPQLDPFTQQLQAALRQATQPLPATKLAKGATIYRAGDQDATVYVIESNVVKSQAPNFESEGRKEAEKRVHQRECARAQWESLRIANG